MGGIAHSCVPRPDASGSNLGILERRLVTAVLTTQESNTARFKDVDTLRERVGILERRLLEIEVPLARFAVGVLPRRAVAWLQ